MEFFVKLYIIGDFKLTQSGAIMRYLGRKHNLYGNNEADMAKVDMVVDTALDFCMGFFQISYNPDFVRREKIISSVKNM